MCCNFEKIKSYIDDVNTQFKIERENDKDREISRKRIIRKCKKINNLIDAVDKIEKFGIHNVTLYLNNSDEFMFLDFLDYEQKENMKMYIKDFLINRINQLKAEVENQMNEFKAI